MSVLAISALAGLILLAWLVLQWAILPRIEYWRPDVERRAAQALGAPVRIGAIEVTDAGFSWRWARAIELRDVVVYRQPAEAATPPADPASVAPQEALRLPSVRAALSPASFLPGSDGRWRLRLAQLLIVGAELDVRREADGRILVAGLPVSGGADDQGAGADWFFSQPEFAIRGGRVVWTDAMREAPPLALEAVDLVVRNGVRSHSLRLDATPPAALGARFSLRGEFTQPLLGPLVGDTSGPPGASVSLLARPGDWRRWRGTVFADVPEADIEPLRRHVDLPVDVARGAGALRMWVDIKRAQPIGATVDLALRDVVVRDAAARNAGAQAAAAAAAATAAASGAGTPVASTAAGLPIGAAEPLSFARIDGRLTASLDDDGAFWDRSSRPSGGQLRAEHFGFTTSDGVVWPAADLQVDGKLGADGAWASGAVKAPRLDLKLLADVATRLPTRWLSADLRKSLVSLAPQGIATEVDARWEGRLPAPTRYTVKAKVDGLVLASRAADLPAQAAHTPEPAASGPVRMHLGRPGVDGADVDFSATEAGGEARIAMREGHLEFPGVFDEPRVPFDRLDAQVAWRFEASRDGAPPALEVRAREVRFANADAQGEFQARWTRATAGTPRAVTAGGAATARPAAASAVDAGASSPGPGVLDLTGRLERAQAVRVARYLPLGLPVNVRHYVERAVQGGQASAVNFKVRGDLKDFPFGPKEGGPVRPGDFRIAARLENVQFAYMPGEAPVVDGAAATAAAASASASASGTPVPTPAVPAASQRAWPAFTAVQGDLIFDRQAMELRNLQGRLGTVGSGGFQFTKVRGGIADMSHHAELTIEGTGRGPLGDVLAYVGATPVGGWIGGALSQASVPAGAARNGPIDLQLALGIPLQHAADSTVRGSVVLGGNDLRLRPELPLMTNARARMSFTERSFTLAGGSARLLGGEAVFDGGTQADGSLRFSGQGTATAEGLRGSDVAALAKPAAALSGQSGYRVAVGVVRGQPEWQVSSSLIGMAIDLPAPLRKSAEQSLPLRVAGGPAPGGAAASVASPTSSPTSSPTTSTASPAPPASPPAPARDLLRVELGAENARVLQAAWLRESALPGSRVLRGAIGVLDAMPTLQDGVVAQVAMDRLDVDAWRQAIARLDSPAAASSAASAPIGAVAAASSGAAASPGGADASAYLPTTVSMRVQELDAFGRRLHKLAATVTRGTGADDGLWRAQVDATELEGEVEYRTPRSVVARSEAGDTGAKDAAKDAAKDSANDNPSEAAGRVRARLSRLVLPRQESDAVSSLLDQASPTTLPALDISVDELELNGKRLGRIEIDAVNRPAEGGRGPGEWRLNKFRLASSDASLSATGHWGATDANASAAARRRASLDFRLDIADGGALLARMGQKDVLRGAKGQLVGQVSWQGSPMAIDHPSLNGQVRVEVEGGQFLKADPGIAKLLGVLSLQALPRRLLLDFRDVFEQGFAFDSVDGDVDITQGVASTRNLRMRGVQATVLMEGRADIARETQDLRVWVVPELNAGAASLAVAVINPAVGIGSFLAQLFLRKPLVEAGTREFHITGPWSDPKVDRIERERTSPPSEAASAARPAAPAEPAASAAVPQTP